MATSSTPRRILIVYSGSRGDWQPYVVAGTILREAGYQVQLCGPGDAAGIAADHDLPFQRIRQSVLRNLDDKLVDSLSHEKMVQLPMRSDRDEMIAEKKAEYDLFLNFQARAHSHGPSDLGPLMLSPSAQSGHEFGGDQMQQMLCSC